MTLLADIDVSGVSMHLGETLAAAGLLALFAWIGATWRASHRRDVKIDRILQLFEGEPADPLANRPATLGVLGQINELRLAMDDLSRRVTALEATVKGGQRD